MDFGPQAEQLRLRFSVAYFTLRVRSFALRQHLTPVPIESPMGRNAAIMTARVDTYRSRYPGPCALRTLALGDLARALQGAVAAVTQTCRRSTRNLAAGTALLELEILKEYN
jgi:hypothetical protein